MGGHHEARPGTEHPQPRRFLPHGMYRSIAPPHAHFAEAVATYRDQLHKNFRLTPRTIVQGIMIGVLIPFAVYTNLTFHKDNFFREHLNIEPPKSANTFGWAGKSMVQTFFDDNVDPFESRHNEQLIHKRSRAQV